MSACPPALWTAREAAAATGGTITGAWHASGVSIDSRTLEPGDLFVALKGPCVDGHDHVGAALASGAAAAVVQRPPAGVAASAPLLRVENALSALQALGAAARERTVARVVAVTGSVGKTGTKEALRLVLGEQAATHANPASYNNQWGVPVSLARMPRNSVYGVFELGMNHPGELAPLARLVRPHVAIVTTVEAVHLAHFNDVEAIADAKAEIFQGLAPQGAVILNRDNAYFSHLAAAARRCGASQILDFGAAPQSWARLVDTVHQAHTSSVSAEIGGEAIAYRIGAPGRHWVLNSLAVLAAVKLLGADLGLAGLALARFSVPEGRGRRLRIVLPQGSFELIDESYNASPVAVRAALAVLAAAEMGTPGRRIAVLGDMLELGPQAPRLHAALTADIAATGVDLVFTAGAHMAYLDAALPPSRRAGHAADSATLAPLVAAAVAPGDVVMVKGSLASRMTEVVAALRRLETPPRAANG